MTIREIAALTELSSSTVYRALKNPKKAKPQVLELINSTINTPYQTKSPLKKVYIILPYLNTFYTYFIIHAITLFAQENIMAVPFISDDDLDKETKFLKSLPLSSRTGLLWCPVSNSANHPFLKRKTNKVPLVLLYRQLKNYKADIEIMQNNIKGIHSIFIDFIQQGYSKILLLNGPITKTTASERMSEFQNVLSQFPHIQGDYVTADFNSWVSAYLALKKIPEADFQYDAIISTSEFLSYGLLKFLKEKNIFIPEDIKVVTFDYTPVFEALSIKSLDFHPEQIALKAVQSIIKKSIDPDYKEYCDFIAD